MEESHSSIFWFCNFFLLHLFSFLFVLVSLLFSGILGVRMHLKRLVVKISLSFSLWDIPRVIGAM